MTRPTCSWTWPLYLPPILCAVTVAQVARGIRRAVRG